MSKADLKKEKDLFKDLDKLYSKNKSKIIDWLKKTAIEYNEDDNGKISNLLTASKIQINTSTEYGVYNLILKWFLNNKDKFNSSEVELFNDIPSTDFTKISKEIMMQSVVTNNSLNIEEALKKWKKNPTIDPYNDTEVKISIVSNSNYGKLYEKFIIHLTKDLSFTSIPQIFENIRKQLPTNHIYVSKEIDYIENLKSLYSDDNVENKWIDFLVKQKDLIYTKEKILDKMGYTVYDHLFMHFYLKKNKKHFENNYDREKYIDNQEFLYETIENQIKLVKAVDMDSQEVFDSMLTFTSEENKGINFEVKRTTVSNGLWPYKVPSLLKLFIEYIYEITYYILSIKRLHSIIFHDYFLYGNTKVGLDNKKKIEYIDNSIEYNKYRLKTILNLILGSMYNSDNSEKINIKTFLKILWTMIKDTITEEQKYIKDRIYHDFRTIETESILKNKIDSLIGVEEIKNIKMFFVSSIFDIETVHKESQENNNVLYEPVIDPYNNLPEPPKMPRAPVISQDLQRYKMTSHINGKNSAKEQELKEHSKKEKEFKKELKSYDKKLKEYNDKYLDKKLSPYFSVKLSRAKSAINDRNSLRLSYSPLKVSAKSLTKFKSNKNKELLSKFEKEPYSRTYKQKGKQEKEKEREKEEREPLREEQRELLRARRDSISSPDNESRGWSPDNEDLGWMRASSDSITSDSESQHSDIRSRSSRSSRSSGYSSSGGARIQMKGGTKTKLSKSDLKLKLALEADNPKFKKYAKLLSPSGKSPRQKYVGCDLNANDPITQETLGDLHLNKIKYLSKIKTTLSNGKIITHCYDTIPLYNYILDCNNKGEDPINLAMGKDKLTIEQKKEVFKKIKFFTKQPTLELNISTTKKIFLKSKYKPAPQWTRSDHFDKYHIISLITIGSIDFDVLLNGQYWGGREQILHHGPIISRDDMLFEDTSDETVLLIQKGIENGSLLKVNTYPYWSTDRTSNEPPFNYKLLSLPAFSFSDSDSIEQLEERTKVFNDRLRRII